MSKKHREIHLPGCPICEGVAIGHPFFFTYSVDDVPHFNIAVNEIEEEVERYKRAIERSKKELGQLQDQLFNEGTHEGVSIIGAHLQMLDDPLLTEEVVQRIVSFRKNTEFILNGVLSDYEARFKQVQDSYFRERLKDIHDVMRRLMAHLRKSVRMSLADIPMNSIVFAQELVPSDTAEAKVSHVNAFVTHAGGQTSHAAILAKAKGIPYVSSVDFSIVSSSYNGLVIVDGLEGKVIVDPTDETVQRYRLLEKALEKKSAAFSALNRFPCETIDGYSVRLSCNVEDETEIEANEAVAAAAGIGLFRSEFLFLSKDKFPGESEQFFVYRDLAQAMAGRPVNIRTFDVGGDKISKEYMPKEENPFLGCRAIRFLLKEPKIFREQLRAILRASAFGTVRILLPMISGLPELLEAKRIIEIEKNSLHNDGVAFDSNIAIGCMIEVPSAAITCDVLAEHCDFLSIGTNDLVQYALAVDRGNQQLNYLYRPTHPSVIRLIKMVVHEAQRAQIPVSLCGEIAADPYFTPLLLGLGVRELSVTPRAFSQIKRAIRATSLIAAQQLADRILRMSTASDIHHALMCELVENRFYELPEEERQALRQRALHLREVTSSDAELALEGA